MHLSLGFGHPGLERAIGVIYRPETDLQSHYFHADLPRQFDEWIWFDESEAVRPLGRARAPELPQRHLFPRRLSADTDDGAAFFEIALARPLALTEGT